MVTKKIELGMNIDDFPMIPMLPLQSNVEIGNGPIIMERHDFAVAALESLDWNQIGMGVDQAAQLCWAMADAMVRNK